jgi:hypothetical protein
VKIAQDQIAIYQPQPLSLWLFHDRALLGFRMATLLPAVRFQHIGRTSRSLSGPGLRVALVALTLMMDRLETRTAGSGPKTYRSPSFDPP